MARVNPRFAAKGGANLGHRHDDVGHRRMQAGRG
jgi:hypothetical protein